ncbi:MAG: tRNA (adenosine(37)-N6)-dimethylallyltransferase MiaA [Alloprevotella sp.]|nr:tRNA (adenosine(37)-N6)-dimethylallyltransferase MiaA [Prevotellamassilia sp.]MDY5763121.1 tRNA (adenosine(37)-N6)-dimethylallyltransferase MiaA [Alloprevotella sp.]MDY6113880.1 tRNA (adenosine(37)-N6)-dimethylallyltransferase MiaA [Alloprevotella sp.]
MKTLVVITGPTGIGKTDLALMLAEQYHTPIVNADSRQIYRDMPIGTAAPKPEQLSRVKHYFVGTLGLDASYHAARFETEALAVLDQVFAERDIAILSGGSMLYIDAVCRGIDAMPDIRPEVRHQMKQRLEREGLEALAAELALLDPVYHAECDLCNPVRVVHALEICHQTGKPFSSFRTSRAKERPFRILKIGLRRERAELFSRIAARVGEMQAEGLVEEARRLLPYRHFKALNTVGYKELFAHFDGLWSLEQALEKISRNTRVYAKKQMTWLQKDTSVNWFHPEDSDGITKFLLENGV